MPDLSITLCYIRTKVSGSHFWPVLNRLAWKLKVATGFSVVKSRFTVKEQRRVQQAFTSGLYVLAYLPLAVAGMIYVLHHCF